MHKYLQRCTYIQFLPVGHIFRDFQSRELNLKGWDFPIFFLSHYTPSLKPLNSSKYIFIFLPKFTNIFKSLQIFKALKFVFDNSKIAMLYSSLIYFKLLNKRFDYNLYCWGGHCRKHIFRVLYPTRRTVTFCIFWDTISHKLSLLCEISFNEFNNLLTFVFCDTKITYLKKFNLFHVPFQKVNNMSSY